MSGGLISECNQHVIVPKNIHILYRVQYRLHCPVEAKVKKSVRKNSWFGEIDSLPASEISSLMISVGQLPANVVYDCSQLTQFNMTLIARGNLWLLTRHVPADSNGKPTSQRTFCVRRTLSFDSNCSQST